MSGLFIDTSGWGNLFDTSQSYHFQATEIYLSAKAANQKIITTNYVIIELVSLLISPLRMPRRKIIALIEGLKKSPYLRQWNKTWASTRIHGTTKRQVNVMFTEEKPHLQPLPQTTFAFFKIGTRKVNLVDSHIEVADAYYPIPPQYMGKQVTVHFNQQWVKVCIRSIKDGMSLRGSVSRRRRSNHDLPQKIASSR